MGIKENELISRELKICENCEWCVPDTKGPKCLLSGKQTGLFQQCESYKERTGNHINM